MAQSDAILNIGPILIAAVILYFAFRRGRDPVTLPLWKYAVLTLPALFMMLYIGLYIGVGVRCG